MSCPMLMLADTGRETSRLGYGCSSLMGAMGERESLGLLEAAFEAGVRHFDVAPMYGYGAAEACVGKFLRRHPGAVTVTTKFGLAAGKNGSLLGLARRVAGPLVKAVPGLKTRLQKAAGAVSGPAARSGFTVAEARESMDRSLRALGVDRIDVWLLHEVEPADLGDEALLRFLEEAKSAGKIGAFGVGSDAWKVDALARERPEYCEVVQHEWSVREAKLAEGRGFRILHRALAENFRALAAKLSGAPDVCRAWSDAVGAELAEREVLANLMLKAALQMNPRSVVLVSSKNAAHIAANVRLAGDEALAGPARKLYELVQSENVLGDVPGGNRVMA